MRGWLHREDGNCKLCFFHELTSPELVRVYTCRVCNFHVERFKIGLFQWADMSKCYDGCSDAMHAFPAKLVHKEDYCLEDSEGCWKGGRRRRGGGGRAKETRFARRVCCFRLGVGSAWRSMLHWFICANCSLRFGMYSSFSAFGRVGTSYTSIVFRTKNSVRRGSQVRGRSQKSLSGLPASWPLALSLGRKSPLEDWCEAIGSWCDWGNCQE